MVKQMRNGSKVALRTAKCNAKVMGKHATRTFIRRMATANAEARRKLGSASGDQRVHRGRAMARMKSGSASGDQRASRGSDTACKKSEAARGDSQRSPEGAKRSGSPCTAYKRQKVRVTYYGVRVWVNPVDRNRAQEIFHKTRLEQQSWTSEDWKERAYEAARTAFLAGRHGGRPVGVPIDCQLDSNRDSVPSTTNHSFDDIQSRAGQEAPPVAGHATASEAVVISQNKRPGGALSNQSELALRTSPRVVELAHATSSAAAEYDCSHNAPVMLPTAEPVVGIPFTPQPVVDWLYDVVGRTYQVLQCLLGTHGSFESSGTFIDRETKEPLSGGMVCGFWGTEIGARRDQALIAWDYDADFAVFKTRDFDFGCLWRQASQILESQGLRCIEHTTGFKFRVCPANPLAFNDWRERRQHIHLVNPGLGRSGISTAASQSKKSGDAFVASGSNCLDIEVYNVVPAKPITILGTKKISANTEHLFPIVEGIFGPLRLPLPATPYVLDEEYGSHWSRVREVKVIHSCYKAKTITVRDAGVKRCAWPTIPLDDCGPLLGAYSGAGVVKSDSDIPWRFL